MAQRDEQAPAAVSFSGDEASFARVLSHYETPVVRFCLRFVGDGELARDLAQEVFVTLWRERERYREKGQLKAYLFRIARLRCLAALKKGRSRRRVIASYLDQASSPGHPESAIASAQMVEKALAGLPVKARELVIMKHLEGMSLDEIAFVTGLRIGTVKSRLSRAMAKLHAEVER